MTDSMGITRRLPSIFAPKVLPSRGVSDHFDGTRFFNPTLSQRFSPGFSDIVGMMKEGRPKWPRHIENLASPSFNEDLGSNGIAITFVNHATFLIQLPGLNILTDPVWADRVSPISWIGPKRVRSPGVLLEDLPRIDLVLISHNHYDHLDIGTLKELHRRFRPRAIVPIGDRRLVESTGMIVIAELDWWESVDVGDARITLNPAQHSSSRTLFDRDRSLWGSYFVRRHSNSIYYGGDGGYCTHFSDIGKRMGSPDVAILGIGAFAPRWFMKPIHMDPAEAAQAHKDLGARLSIGMHFSTFQLASEAFEQPTADLKVAVEKEGLAPGSFITLKEGETRVCS
ncbi:MBL fold metallo-hydrolase [Agrobacterium pusense]|uniref:MBL fold metallo-hydrolase n=1 Tax=Agrobacterium pusense TaxID=648995 RepID=UPI001C6E6C88|nr:MBL fold metallo-hydrolase [Agrobacterium pusense]